MRMLLMRMLLGRMVLGRMMRGRVLLERMLLGLTLLELTLIGPILLKRRLLERCVQGTGLNARVFPAAGVTVVGPSKHLLRSSGRAAAATHLEQCGQTFL